MSSSNPNPDVVRATVAGARSLRVVTWEGEELVGAALERLARRPCESTFEAYRQGRAAAIDELRRLTGGRRYAAGRAEARRVRSVVLDPERHAGPRPFDEVEDADAFDRWSARYSSRQRAILRVVAHGGTLDEAARCLRVSPGRVSQLLRPVKARGSSSLREACA